MDEIIKGKAPLMLNPPGTQEQPQPNTIPKRWPRPPAGVLALSVDGSYNGSDGSAGSGMILRDDKGGVIFAAYRKIFNCNEALEAELQAMAEGFKLAAEHSSANILLQSDCSLALKALSDDSLDRSMHGHLVRTVKGYLKDRVVIPVKIHREQNRVADSLANYGRCGDSTTCWLRCSPPCVSMLIAEDCKPVTLE